MIADDSPEMRWLVRSAVADEFGDIVEAADGRELLWTLLRTEYARTKSPERQVIVTDHCMPGYDGLDVLEAWRELHPTGRAILITAFPSDEVQSRAAKLGAVMLAKPFSTSTLRRILREP